MCGEGGRLRGVEAEAERTRSRLQFPAPPVHEAKEGLHVAEVAERAGRFGHHEPEFGEVVVVAQVVREVVQLVAALIDHRVPEVAQQPHVVAVVLGPLPPLVERLVRRVGVGP